MSVGTNQPQVKMMYLPRLLGYDLDGLSLITDRDFFLRHCAQTDFGATHHIQRTPFGNTSPDGNMQWHSDDCSSPTSAKFENA
jgi:hypothetical protein